MNEMYKASAEMAKKEHVMTFAAEIVDSEGAMSIVGRCVCDYSTLIPQGSTPANILAIYGEHVVQMAREIRKEAGL